MIPGAGQIPIRGRMAAARPLIKDIASDGRSTSRTYRCYNHIEEGAPGFFSIIGGKTTTARHMAEKMSDMVCTQLGINTPCKTQTEPLVSYRLGM